MYWRYTRETRYIADGTQKHCVKSANFHPDVTRSRKNCGFLHLACKEFPAILTQTKNAKTTLQRNTTTDRSQAKRCAGNRMLPKCFIPTIKLYISSVITLFIYFIQ